MQQLVPTWQLCDIGLLRASQSYGNKFLASQVWIIDGLDNQGWTVPVKYRESQFPRGAPPGPLKYTLLKSILLLGDIVLLCNMKGCGLRGSINGKVEKVGNMYARAIASIAGCWDRYRRVMLHVMPHPYSI